MATTSLLKREIKFVSIISLCALLWTLTPDAFAVSGKNKNIMDPRLADFNSKLDMILQKLNHFLMLLLRSKTLKNCYLILKIKN